MAHATTQDLDPGKIDEPTDAIRRTIDPERVAALADDIAGQGQLQEIGVRGPNDAGRYEVIWGHRRYLAIKLLGRDAIRARVFPWDVDPLHARTMENFGQEAMTPLEEADVCRRYMERHGNLSAVARLVRHSAAWVAARLELLKYPPELQDAVQRGELALNVAHELAKIDHDELRHDYVNEAIRTGSSASLVRVWVAHYESDRERLIHNHVTIEQLIAERGTFVMLQQCEGCHRNVEARVIRSLHLCDGCMADLRQAFVEANGTTP